MVRDCSDIGKTSLADVAECQEAASQLGINYWGDFSWPEWPNRCFSDYKDVYWNTHETGASRNNNFPVCRSGNYKHTYCVEISKGIKDADKGK